MPTRYGALNFPARTVDEHTFRCDIGPGVAAAIELRPPLSGPLVGVTVNGRAREDFGNRWSSRARRHESFATPPDRLDRNRCR
jgi:hypothetical protein